MKLRRDQRGAVLVEYALLLTFVAMPTIAGITLGGLQLLGSYRVQKARVLAPYP